MFDILFHFLIRKKNKDSKNKKLIEIANKIEEETPRNIEIKRTKAEIAFQKMQEKMVISFFHR